jgi:3-keto-5-aminohexanoate cleavage enzyme
MPESAAAIVLEANAPRPVVIAVAPNGARRTRQDHPRLPVDIESLGAECVESARSGASLVHVHVRDNRGAHSLDAALYQEAVQEIRRVTHGSLVIQITTEAVGRYSPADQMHVSRSVDADSVSLALREIAPAAELDADQRKFFKWLADAKPVPQYILYDASDIERLLRFIDQGSISAERMSVLLVLGRYSKGQRADPRSLIALLPYTAAFETWFVCSFGSVEAQSVIGAATLGGHIRVGFENNLQRPDGSRAISNADNVGRIARILGELGLRAATAEECRRLISGKTNLGFRLRQE